MTERTYKEAMDNVKQSADFEQKALKRIAHSQRTDKRPFKGKAVWASAAVVFLVGILILALPLFRGTNIQLPNSSKGITAEYVQDAPQQRIQAKLMWFSEEQLFKHPSAIFLGTVTEARNIKIAMGSDVTYYWAVVKIRAEEVYRGNIKTGDTVRILLRCPVEKGEVWIEDSGVVSAIKKGMKGIFMPTSVGDDEIELQDGVKLALSDLAEYSFRDGQRYAFLEAKDGLIYDQSAYPSLEGAKTLSAVKAFVIGMAAK